MNKSESITELAKALVLAQAEMKGAVKDSKNPFFKSTYADLASVWDAIRGPFTKNGLSFVQAVKFMTEFPDYVFVETAMFHTSGEYVSGEIGMKPVKQDPQSVGSCITYCRRYGLQALSGVAPEDDDGNAASGTGNGKGNKPVEASKPSTPTPTIPQAEKVDPGPSGAQQQVSEAQIKRLFTIANKSDKSKSEIKGWLEDRGMMSSKELTPDKYDALVEWISAPKSDGLNWVDCPDGQRRVCDGACPIPEPCANRPGE